MPWKTVSTDDPDGVWYCKDPGESVEQLLTAEDLHRVLTGFPRPAWHRQAACRGKVAQFFPTRGESTAEAKAICASCPVREQCLEQALTRPAEKHGIWGQLSERERRKLRRLRQRAA